MSKFKDDVVALVPLLGGKENINAVTHCATRLRFVLNDPSKADIEKIEELKSVRGSFTTAGQFQLVIGNDVPIFYNELLAYTGIEGVSKEEVKSAAKQNVNPLQRLVANFGEIFAPIIPALVVGGLILGFRNILEGVMLMEGGTKTIVEVSQFWSGVNHFLWLIGEAIFHFLPVAITWSIARKTGTSQVLGIVLGITLVSPQLLNAYGVANINASDIPFWNFGFARVNMIGYQAQVIPAMLAGFTFAYLEKFFRKVVPEYVSMIFVPLFSLVPAVLLAHTILGPVGWWLGDKISAVVYAGLASSMNFLFAGLFGFLYAPLVITGLHHMTNAIDLQLMAQYGSTNLWPMIALSNIAQGSAVLAIIFLHKKNEEEKQISIPATISCYLGVTEPAMFGINLKYTYPFIAGMTGSAIAAVISVASGVTARSIGIGGIPGILSIKDKPLMFLIAMIVAIVVPIALTVFFNKSNILVRDGKK